MTPRQHRARLDQFQRGAAATGQGFSLPDPALGPDGKPTGKRMPITLIGCFRHTYLWVALLTDAMVRSGRGLRRDSLRRTGRGDDRRPDKIERDRLWREHVAIRGMP